MSGLLRGLPGLVRVDLPHPPRELRPNARAHWAAKARAVRYSRAESMQMAMARMLCLRLGRFEPKSYTLYWYYKGIAPDADNCLASCKAYIDGCCDAFGVDDRQLECAGIHRVYSKEFARYVSLVFSREGAL